MVSANLLILADRVEGLSGPDREIDAAIYRWAAGRSGDVDAVADSFAPAYTASLDSAASLLPEGWGYLDLTRYEGGTFGCSIEAPGFKVDTIRGNGATAVLALLSASLRAIAANQEASA